MKFQRIYKCRACHAKFRTSECIEQSAPLYDANHYHEHNCYDNIFGIGDQIGVEKFPEKE